MRGKGGTEMSDKPTRDQAIEKAIKQGATEAMAVGVITFLSVQYPDWFAPEPDPVEEFIAQYCGYCDYNGPCNVGLSLENSVYRDCQLSRIALRAYVADLRKRAEGCGNAK